MADVKIDPQRAGGTESRNVRTRGRCGARRRGRKRRVRSIWSRRVEPRGRESLCLYPGQEGRRRGTSNPAEICAHAIKYAATLKLQVELYRPHLVLGCGVGRDSPARLVAKHVLPGGRERVTSKTGATWWEFPVIARPRAMVQVWHPAWRGSRSKLYKDVWSSVREVATQVGLRQRQ